LTRGVAEVFTEGGQGNLMVYRRLVDEEQQTHEKAVGTIRMLGMQMEMTVSCIGGVLLIDRYGTSEKK